MSNEQALAVFENFKIRRVYDEKSETWYFSVVDIVAALIQQPDYQIARKYWNKLKERLKKEGSQSVTNCHQLKLPAADGKKYLTDVAPTETLLRIIQSVPSSRAEPGLFKKVTGLTVKDFELLVSLGVFNSALMNDAVYKFKRYEDASLSYTGINRHEGEDIGLYDTVLTRKDAQKVFENVPAGAQYRA
jgi:hypothetical protein